MNASIEEPVIPPRLQRPLAAVWISLGLHAALLALVQVAPPAALSLGDPGIEARLVSSPAVEAAPTAPEVEMPTDPPPEAAPLLVPSAAADALPVAEPMAPPPAEPPAAASTAEAPAASAAGTITAPSDEPASAAPVASAPAATITTAVDLTYYGARDVDVPPRALREIVPDYPALADRERLSGTVRLQLKLEADGRIGAIEVVSASPPGIFDESAIKAFGDARFAPAQKNGRPVRALVLIEVVYDWEGRR
ncbi:MAG: energy transducer TonB [Betaproteobacteria bacterium HGW-Betaproteobacteria-17]|nr:MAG: energy transducer TonB [Betaproteobacteria bacterium HGW-Betaproteobacteria-17]